MLQFLGIGSQAFWRCDASNRLNYGSNRVMGALPQVKKSVKTRLRMPLKWTKYKKLIPTSPDSVYILRVYGAVQQKRPEIAVRPNGFF
ncbi:MAG: hypothetical protein KDI88_07160 [Gammaproteobacteria bacterium]|nr:hypothetical protein [Caldilineaceae bacterium]MCB1773379.1 hypothetical protein [Gammaproteobacteria bacterium]